MISTNFLTKKRKNSFTEITKHCFMVAFSKYFDNLNIFIDLGLIEITERRIVFIVFINFINF